MPQGSSQRSKGDEHFMKGSFRPSNLDFSRVLVGVDEIVHNCVCLSVLLILRFLKRFKRFRERWQKQLHHQRSHDHRRALLAGCCWHRSQHEGLDRWQHGRPRWVECRGRRIVLVQPGGDHHSFGPVAPRVDGTAVQVPHVFHYRGLFSTHPLTPQPPLRSLSILCGLIFKLSNAFRLDSSLYESIFQMTQLPTVSSWLELICKAGT